MATDFISREAAKTLIHDRAIEMALNNVGFKADASDILEHISKRSMDWIDEVPAADVRPAVRGEWERPKGYTPRSWIFVCSKCGDRAYFPVPKYFPKGCGYSFCPNCGADMMAAKIGKREESGE